VFKYVYTGVWYNISVVTSIHFLQKLVEEIQQMEPELQLFSENASLLLDGTSPDEEPTKSFDGM